MLPCTRDDAIAVLRRLREAGHTAYFAGGCVRDLLLGLEPKDYDVATDAPPDRVRQLFRNTQAVGAAFGVILVRQGKSVVEVATFRTDHAYADGRRPTGVTFSTPEEDAQRRDFTINGLFLDPVADQVIDFVGGRADLAARRLRAIGDPAARFGEDHLRLLRAVRFAARFGFEIEPTTAAAIRKSAPHLQRISPERVGDELRRILTPTTRSNAWQMLWDLALAHTVFRHLAPRSSALAPSPGTPGEGRGEGTQDSALRTQDFLFPQVAPGAPISAGLALAAAALCYRRQTTRIDDLRPLLTRPGAGQLVRAMRQGLKISNEESDEMQGALEGLTPLLADPFPTVAQLKRFLARPTSGASRHLLGAFIAVGLHAQRIDGLRPRLAELEKTEVAPLPLLTGDDLTAAGYAPGPLFKRLLDAVYDAQLELRIDTKGEALALARTLAGPANDE